MSYNQKLEDRTANENNFGCSRKKGDTVSTDTDLQLRKISLCLVKI